MTEPCRLEAVEALRRLRDGRLTATALLDSCLDRIAAREPSLRAFAHLDPAAARRQAAAVDAAGPGDDLCGLPVGIKDIIDTADMPTRYGSARHADRRPERDADCVTTLRRARAVLPGKTATTEFAGAQPAPTRHPTHEGFSPGGSSAGSAAAVADCLIPVAVGTQTAGSVIRPAAYCGIVGLKASYGLVSLAGVRPAAPSFDTFGTFGRTVADAALALAASAGRRDLRAGPAVRPRIGLCAALPWDAPEAGMEAALETGARLAGAAGASVRDVRLPEAFASAIADHVAVMGAETYRSTFDDLSGGAAGLGPLTVAAARAGALVTPDREAAARERLARCRALLDTVFAEVDLLLCPSAAGEAPEGLGWTGDPLFNRLWTALGGPCVTLPFGSGPRGLPLGLQLVARPGADALLVSGALWLERVLQGRTPAAEPP